MSKTSRNCRCNWAIPRKTRRWRFTRNSYSTKKHEVDSDFISWRSPHRNHGNADVNPTTQAYDAHNNKAERVEDANNDNVGATDGDDRPDVHVDESQAGDQPREVVEDDKNDVDIVEDDNNDVD